MKKKVNKKNNVKSLRIVVHHLVFLSRRYIKDTHTHDMNFRMPGAPQAPGNDFFGDFHDFQARCTGGGGPEPMAVGPGPSKNESLGIRS